MDKWLTLTDENINVQTMLLLTQVSNAIVKYIDHHLFMELDLSYIKYLVLKVLVRNGGTLKHSDIADWTNTKKHNISALVDRMKINGLVSTEWSKTDRRVNSVVITDKGRKQYKKAKPLVRQILGQVMTDIDGKDTHEFERLLKQIGNNIISMMET